MNRLLIVALLAARFVHASWQFLGGRWADSDEGVMVTRAETLIYDDDDDIDRVTPAIGEGVYLCPDQHMWPPSPGDVFIAIFIHSSVAAALDFAWIPPRDRDGDSLHGQSDKNKRDDPIGTFITREVNAGWDPLKTVRLSKLPPVEEGYDSPDRVEMCLPPPLLAARGGPLSKHTLKVKVYSEKDALKMRFPRADWRFARVGGRQQ